MVNRRVLTGPRACGAGLVALALAVALGAARAETQEEWLRKQREAAEKFGASGAEFRAAQDREFSKSRTAQDREFSRFLAEGWRQFRAFEGLSRNLGPKPKTAPAVVPVVQPQSPPVGTVPQSVPQPAQQPAQPPAPQPAQLPAEPPAPQPAKQPSQQASPAAKPPESAPVPDTGPTPAPPKPAPAPRPQAGPPAADPAIPVVPFFGQQLRIPLDARWRGVSIRSRTSKEVARFWDAMSGSAVQPAVAAVEAACRDLPLDDWGRVLLWQEVARQLRPGRPDDQLLLTWYFLLMSGVDARVGMAGDSLLLLIAVRQPVFGEVFVTVDGQRYYALLKSGSMQNNAGISMPDGQYPGRLRPLDIPAASTAFIGPSTQSRTLRFESGGQHHTYSVSFDPQLVSYLSRFPQLDFDPYFASPPGRLASRTLVQALREEVGRMNEEQALNFLLALVQKSFEYKTDAEQFGREKYFFAEEVLFYPFSDCEDRSVLFAWLVRELLGLDVVGLHYPGHVATAVAMSSVREGWSTVQVNGRRYVVADPTYINATVGMAMPSYAGTRPLKTIAGFQGASTRGLR